MAVTKKTTSKSTTSSKKTTSSKPSSVKTTKKPAVSTSSAKKTVSKPVEVDTAAKVVANKVVDRTLSEKPSSSTNKDYAVQMLDITKTFLDGKIVANKDLTLKVARNEIHAIIGENGAGKSTLMSILFGLYEPDSGKVLINNKEVKFESAVDAHKQGIGMVHQHFKLVENYPVLHNIILGVEPYPVLNFAPKQKNANSKDPQKPINPVMKPIPLKGLVNFKEAKARINFLIQKYGFNVDINAKVENLTVGQQQKVEILKLLYLNSDILIFDEPTAVLSDVEIESFLQMLRDFKAEGKTIIIITHKLNEVKKIADRATVIRLGRYVADFDVKDTSVQQMAELMVGRSLKPVINDGDGNCGTEVILKVENLPLQLLKDPNAKTFFQLASLNERWTKLKIGFYNFAKWLRLDKITDLKEPKQINFHKSGVNFEVKAGEIVAIAGVEGNGQSELVKYITGAKKAPAGTIKFNSRKQWRSKLSLDIRKFFGIKETTGTLNDISLNSINKRLKDGISWVPEDRHKDGLFLDDSVAYNTVCNWMYNKNFNFYGFVNKNAINNHALKIINEFDVRGVGSLDDPVRGLSGGNQQKLIIGREISKGTDFIVFCQPTRGLDLGAIEYIHSRIIQAKNENKAVLLVSYELDEILSLADRIFVMNKNQIVDGGTRVEMTRSRIGLAMAQHKDENLEGGSNE